MVALVLAQLDYCNRVLAGLPASQLSRLQSVLYAAARLIHGIRRYDHVTPCCSSFTGCLSERVTFKLCVLVYRCLHGLGPEYFSEDFKLVSAEIQSRQRLHSASSIDVVVPATRRSSLGDRAFPVAGARTWNALPPSVTSALFLSSFRRLLKTFLFQRQLRQ